MVENRLITPVIVTHFSPKEEYGERRPPSARLVKKTITSMRKHIESNDASIMADPILIYNYPKTIDEMEYDRYLENLIRMSDRHNINLYAKPNTGLREGLQTALSIIDTRYILFLEHDWKFIKDISLTNIVDIMETSGVNYVRFNKRKNVQEGRDTIVEEEKVRNIDLCKTSCYSNNPHIAKVEKYKQWMADAEPSIKTAWRKYRMGKPYNIIHMKNIINDVVSEFVLDEPRVRSFSGVEFVLTMKYREDIQRLGFERAHKKWGIYLYGGFGEGPYVQHLGA